MEVKLIIYDVNKVLREGRVEGVRKVEGRERGGGEGWSVEGREERGRRVEGGRRENELVH